VCHLLVADQTKRVKEQIWDQIKGAYCKVGLALDNKLANPCNSNLDCLETLDNLSYGNV
jgi:hypothetical protein